VLAGGGEGAAASGDPTATQVKLLYVVLTGRTGTFRIIGTIRAKRKSGARIL